MKISFKTELTVNKVNNRQHSINMVKKMFLPVLALCLLFTSACKETDENLINPSLERPIANSAIFNDRSNPDNPYDIYGEMYVNAASYFLQNSTYRGADTTTAKDEYYDLRLEYLLSANPLNIAATSKTEYYTNMNDVDCAKEFSNNILFTHPYIDSALKLLFTTEILSDNTNFIEEVKTLEANVMADVTLLDSIRKNILISTSRIRHLIPYTIGELSNPYSTLNSIITEIKELELETGEEVSHNIAYEHLVTYYFLEFKGNGHNDTDALCLAHGAASGGTL